MASTYLDLHYHIVFSTKYRQPLIAPQWKDDLHGYIGGTLNGLGARPIVIGGTADHVHVLLKGKATTCLADLVRETKKSSTSWVREHQHTAPFSWQEGYAAFTVSSEHRPALVAYIQNQEEHHRTVSPIDELRRLLAEHEVEYDPRYFE